MSANFTFRLGSLDLAPYMRVNPDDGLDLYGAGEWIEPALADTPFGDGQLLTSVDVRSRPMVVPLFLRGDDHSKDQLHDLMARIEVELAQPGLMVEWQDAGASEPTFYDVTFGRFEPGFNHRRHEHGYSAGTLRLWTGGYGHTATTRVLATAQGSGMVTVVTIPSSVQGDAPALLRTLVTVGTHIPSYGRLLAVAPLAHPSYAPLIPAARFTDLMGGAALIGASGAQGSQYLGLPVNPTGRASGIGCKVPLPNPSISGGENRVFLVARTGLGRGVAIEAIDPFGNRLGPTAACSSLDWSVIDLGVARIPTQGLPTVPKITLLAGGIVASGHSPSVPLIASPGLQINQAVVLPNRELLTVLDRTSARGSLISRDYGKGQGALAGSRDDFHNAWALGWNKATSPAVLLRTGRHTILSPATLGNISSARVDLPPQDRMIVVGRPLFAYPPPGASTAWWLRKDLATGAYVQAELCMASALAFPTGHLAIHTATNGVESLLASVAVGNLCPYAPYKLELAVDGPECTARLSAQFPITAAGATTNQAAVAAASNAAVSGNGQPVMAIRSGGLHAGAGFYGWETHLPGSSPLARFDTVTLDGEFNTAHRQGSGSAERYAPLPDTRGAFPRVSPSAPAVAVLNAPLDQGPANETSTVELRMRERFHFAR